MQARRQFIAGDHQGALATLHQFSPQELVAPVIAELETELRRYKRRREETSRGMAAVVTPVPDSSAPPMMQRHAPDEERAAERRSAIEPAAQASGSYPKLPVPAATGLAATFAALTWQQGLIGVLVFALLVAILSYSCG
jgi:hypothetical protein